jgi:hypothetical protein
MGAIYNSQTLQASELPKLSTPILLCVDKPDYDTEIDDSEYQKVSLNLPLARSLSGLPEKDIPSIIASRIRDILPSQKPVYLIDYEMLFDPRYGLDILRLFTDLSRKNKLIVKWYGAANSDTLTYAEPEFEDYKRFKISDYDVSVVM